METKAAKEVLVYCVGIAVALGTVYVILVATSIDLLPEN